MIYISRQNEAFYYVSEERGLFCDLYVFGTMSRTPEAVQDSIIALAERLQLRTVPDDTWQQFKLVMDFMANVRTETMTAVIEQAKRYYESRGYDYEEQETPLRLTVLNLTMDDLCGIINDRGFQALNQSHSFRTWHVVPVS